MTKKQNVILDLDNTIISAEALEEFPFKKPGIEEKASKFFIHDMDGYYIVFERPHLQSFLDWLFSHYNVSVWTAASKDYALFIIEKILLKKPDRKLQFIFFSYHCDLSKKHFNDHKRLKLITEMINIKGFDNNNTIIIDDLPEVHLCQKDASINISAFEILKEDSEKDEELYKMKKVIPKLFSTMSKTIP